MKYTLSTTYTTLLILFISLFFVSEGFIQLLKYILLLIAGYFLYIYAMGEHKSRKSYHQIFLALLIIYVLFRSAEPEGLYLVPNALMLVASLVGLCIVGSKKEYSVLKSGSEGEKSPSKTKAKKVTKNAGAKKSTKKIA